MKRFLMLPTAVKTSEGWHRDGPEAAIDPDQVVAVEPILHSWHSFRQEEELAKVFLSRPASASSSTSR